MEIVDNEKGFKILKLTKEEVIKLGWGLPETGECLCSYCNEVIEGDIYYVAVLGDVLDEKCLSNWYAEAVYYPEDKEYEERQFNYVIGLLEQYEPKKGDYVVIENYYAKNIAIYEEPFDSHFQDSCFALYIIPFDEKNTKLVFNDYCSRKTIRKASKYEIDMLNKVLQKEGKIWNPKTMSFDIIKTKEIEDKYAWVNIFKINDEYVCSSLYDTKMEALIADKDHPYYVTTTKLTWSE